MIYPPVYLPENSLMSSLFNVVIDTQRQIYMYKIVTVRQMLRKLSLSNASGTK